MSLRNDKPLQKKELIKEIDDPIWLSLEKRFTKGGLYTSVINEKGGTYF